MDATELAYAGAAQQARLIAAGEVSSREVVGAALRRIERLDPQVNAFRIVVGEGAPAEGGEGGGRGRGQTRRRRAAARASSACCSACPSRSRTTPTSRACRPRAGRR